MSNLTIKTNRVPRDIIDAYQLTEKERKEFDYLDWDKIDNGEDSANFFRYKGRLYDLQEFMRISKQADELMQKWDGYCSDSYFSGLMVKYVNDCEQVIVGTYFS